MIRMSFFLLVSLSLSQSGCVSDRLEAFTINITGKPVNLSYIYHLKRGSLSWSYQGEVEGSVGVCISGCATIVENQFTSTCPQVQTLSGKFDTASNTGAEEGIEAGTQRCFVFIPRGDSRGTIKIKFKESKIGGW